MPTSKSGGPAPRASRTARLDAAQLAAFREDPEAFARATRRTLVHALVLGLVGLVLLGVAFVIVGFSHGGLALATMAAFPALAGLAALDDFRWRSALIQGKGEIPPPFWRKSPREAPGKAV